MSETERIVAPEAAVRLVHRGMIRDYLDEQQPDYPTRNRRFAGDLEELMHAWIEAARAAERRRVVAELRDFADDLYGITGARWITDALTSTLDRIIEGDAP